MALQSLTQGEAVPLVHSVVGTALESGDVRGLFIKGPALAIQGLREPSMSVDVDVMVSPPDLERSVDRLRSWGWRPIDDNGPSLTPKHSVTLRHSEWPCEVDVHFRFPGLLASPASTFDYLWERRVRVELATQPIWTCDPVSHGAIAALHYLRDGRNPAKQQRLASLAANVSWHSKERRALLDFARATGSATTLAPLFAALDMRPPAEDVPQVRLAEWNLRSTQVHVAGAAWWAGLAEVDLRTLPGYLRRAVMPDEETFRGMHPWVPAGHPAFKRARRQRLLRGLRESPKGMLLYLRRVFR